MFSGNVHLIWFMGKGKYSYYWKLWLKAISEQRKWAKMYVLLRLPIKGNNSYSQMKWFGLFWFTTLYKVFFVVWCRMWNQAVEEMQRNRSSLFFPTYKDAAIEDEHHNFEKAGTTHFGWFLFFHSVEETRTKKIYVSSGENNLSSVITIILFQHLTWGTFLLLLKFKSIARGRQHKQWPTWVTRHSLGLNINQSSWQQKSGGS